MAQKVNLVAASTQYGTITNAAQTGLDFTGAFTIEALVNMQSLATTLGYSTSVVTKTIATGDEIVLRIRGVAGNPIGFVGQSSGGQFNLWGSTSLAALEWVHLTVTHDGAGNYSLYVNGVLETLGGTTGTVGVNLGNTAPFQIGHDNVLSRPFDGSMRFVRVWDVERTATELLTNKCSAITGAQANLTGNWNFDGDMNDESGNSNNLTQVNTPTYSTEDQTTTAGTCFVTDKADFASASSQYLTNAAISGTLAGSFTAGITVEMWLNATNIATRQIPFYLGNSTPANSVRLTIGVHETLDQFFTEVVWTTPSPASMLAFSGSTDVGATKHVAFTMAPNGANSELKLYVGGQLVATDTEVGNNFDYTGGLDVLQIGAGLNTTTKVAEGYSDGSGDKVRIWDYAKTQKLICANANTDYPTGTGGLVGQWELNGDGTDTSGNGNDLTNVNSVTFSTPGLSSALSCGETANRVKFY